ncbi:MAG: acyl-CoA reductase [Verrucomicrobiales bacterium]
MKPPIDSLAQAASHFAPWTGEFDAETLRHWLHLEFGPHAVGEMPFGYFQPADLLQPYGPQTRTRLIPPQTILHIISGNTPHALWQTLLRGLLLGAHNLLKLPSQALPDIEKKIAALPAELRAKITTARELPTDWLARAEAFVVFGSDATIRHFRELAPPHLPFLAHGPKLGIALISEPDPEAARLAARDIATFNQQGCLSLHTLYLPAAEISSFGDELARALAAREECDPRGPLDPSADGAIATWREEIRFLAANQAAGQSDYQLWESPGDTAWTIIRLPGQDELPVSTLNRSVILQPLEALSPDHSFRNPPCERPTPPARLRIPSPQLLSGIALYPYEPEFWPALPSPRLFPLGQAQTPPLLWHHDGIAPLASLVRYQDQFIL